MDILIKKVVDDSDTIWWIFFEHGKVTKPLLLLDDYSFGQLIKSRESQMKGTP
jgi:hypothetical protein